MARLLLKWKSSTRWDLTSSQRKPQFLNPLLVLESSSIGDSVHRPHNFWHISVSPKPPTEENALLDNLLLKSTWERTLQGWERPRVRPKLTLKMDHVKNTNDFFFKKHLLRLEKSCDSYKFGICWQKFYITTVSKCRQKEMCYIHL